MLVALCPPQRNCIALQGKVPLPDVQSGRKSGYQLPPIFCSYLAPWKRSSAANHGYGCQKARNSAGYTAFKNTYEGRTTKPNVMVAKFDASLAGIEKAGWMPPGTMHKHYEKVCNLQVACLPACGQVKPLLVDRSIIARDLTSSAQLTLVIQDTSPAMLISQNRNFVQLLPKKMTTQQLGG